MNSVFQKLCQRAGSYSLPFLIHLYTPDMGFTERFINDTRDRVYDGKTYTASAFTYQQEPPAHGMTGGGTLEIAVKDNAVIDMVESSTLVFLDVIGALLEDGTVSPIRIFRHQYGSVVCDGRKAVFTFEKDDRLRMTFPALIFNHYNNRGNA